MKKKRLGSSEIEVGPLMFGGNALGWTIDESTSFKVLDAFVGAGFDFIDTADVYSAWKPGNQGGESETILGRWMKLRGNRAKIILATKVGMEMGPTKKGLSKKYILSAVEASLSRLQTDYIDLYQSHKDDEETPLAETLEAYADLIKAGKVRLIGASNYTAPRLRESLAVAEEKNLPTYQTLQPLYNLCEREIYEQELEPVCVAKNISVVPYFSLASGFLTGKYRTEADLEKYPRGSRVKKYLNPRGFKILEGLDKVSRNKNCPPARVAVAWIMARPSITAPIASASSVEQLNELVAATRLYLDASEMKILDEASSPSGR